MKNKITKPLIFIILSCASILCACSNANEENSIVYGLTLAPSGIDPHLNASAELGIPLSSVYDTLVFQDPDSGEFVPGLAEDWTISDDGLTYTFSLRDDVTFHDGTSFDADAVIANIDYTLDPENHSFKAALMLGPLAGVEVLDDYTIVIRLEEPYAPLLDALSQVYLGMASPLALETWGSSEYQYHQVGTGPYRFVEYVPNDHLTLARYEDYDWAPSIYNQRKASIETIVFRFYEDAATRALALESGEVDIIGEVPHLDAVRLDADEDFELHPIAIPGQPLQFLFNTLRSPTDDVRVRQALIAAVDRADVVETVFGTYSHVANGPLSAVTKGYSPDAPFPAYDPEHAADLLDAAGWQDDDGDGVRSRDGEDLHIHIVAPSWGSNSEVAQLLRASWETVGASVEIEIAPGFGPLNEAQASGSYHLIGINLFDSDPDILRSFYTSEGFYNWTGYTDPDLDRDLNQAAQASLDADLRWELYAAAAMQIRDQALLIPIRDYVNLVVSNNRLEGLHFSAQGWFPLLIDLEMVH
jgi:peptide/nickel transport system substrate-binding protein